MRTLARVCGAGARSASKRPCSHSRAPSSESFGATSSVQNLGIIACYVFNARVFRPGQIGDALAVAGAALLAISWIGHGIEPGWAGARSHGSWYYLGLATRGAAFVWGAAEAFRYRVRLTRRARVGLADAVVANRMLLWGASYLLIAIGFGVFAAGTVSPGGVNAPAVVLPLAACGLGAATAMTLAFFPPAFYRRWLAGAASELQRSRDQRERRQLEGGRAAIHRRSEVVRAAGAAHAQHEGAARMLPAASL